MGCYRRQTIDMVLMDQMNIKVVDNQYEYKVSPIPFLVYFVKTTSVKEVERLEITANVRIITEIVDIISGIPPRHTLVDVVGVVAEVIERKTVNPAYRVMVKLRDNSDAEIIMTLWEDYVLQLDDAIEKNHFVREPLVLMLTLAKIKDAKDKYPLSVQNIKNGSKLYVNADIAEIKKFRNSLRVPFYVGGVTDEGSAGDEIKVFPLCVDELLGKTWTVRFKYHVHMRQSFVLDVSQEEHHIHTLTSTVGLQDESSIGKSPAACAETSSQDYHPMSADYDPRNTAFVTPAKRMSGQQAITEFDSDDYTTYELSTNKHMKAE
ncbi:hypothetical protein GmHk_10G028341 [Glycine max]|nr:hypothetical protein GmHk_10G028341 [Glycine max]